jgi:hypothetical protein
MGLIPLTTPTFSASETPNATSTLKPASSVQSSDAAEPTESDNNRARRLSETPTPSGEPSDPAGPKSNRRSDFDGSNEDRHRTPTSISSPPSVPVSVDQPTQEPEATEIRRPKHTPRPTPDDRSPPARPTKPPEPAESSDPKANPPGSDQHQPAPTAGPQATAKPNQKSGSDDHGGGSGNDHSPPTRS